MNNSINTIELLLNQIKTNSISWTSLDFFKKYLKLKKQSLRDVNIFRLYALYLQENKFLFDCSDTYFSIYNDSLYILSKNLSEFEFRFDVYKLSENDAKWQQIEAPISLLLRFKNAIVLTNSDTTEECEEVYNVLNSIKE